MRDDSIWCACRGVVMIMTIRGGRAHVQMYDDSGHLVSVSGNDPTHCIQLAKEQVDLQIARRIIEAEGQLI